MVALPRDGRIVGVQQMFEPENNDVTAATLEKAIVHLKSCDCFILDRNCRAQKALEKRPLLSQIKYYPTTKLHAYGHPAKCKNNPLNILRLKRRLRGVNTMVAEQVFSWFRGFARTLNEMRGSRHTFLVLYYCKRHNELVDAGDKAHLNAYTLSRAKSKKTTSGHHCNKRVPKSAAQPGNVLGKRARTR